MSHSQLAAVAVGRPVHGEFTYLVPRELEGTLLPGQRIAVPFGRGTALGFYLGPAEAPEPGTELRLRAILRTLEPRPTVPPELVELMRFAARHYRYPLGEAIRTALPPGLSDEAATREAAPEQVQFAVATPAADPAKLGRAPAQAAVVSYLLAVGGRAALDEVNHAVPGARESLKRLVARGMARMEAQTLQPEVREGLAQGRPTHLTPGQREAVAELCAAVSQGGFQPFLLHGVTGSGKTEVYLQVMEHALSKGRGGLVLVPEIALTPQLVGRFRSRFGAGVAVLHSGLKDRERLRHWQGLLRGDLKVAVGVRSAVFAPVPSLGLIVVDEEHDGSFKQDEKLRYHARDLAVVRAKQAGATVLLGSATPSLETLENTRRGRYRRLTLPVRVDDRPMPKIELVDLRHERPRVPESVEEPPILAAPSIAALEETLSRGQQAILFLNRRGHSTFLLCRVCGTGVRCDACDVSLTHHLSLRKVVCHYCGFSSGVPERCRDCAGELVKLGVGTEKVEAEVALRFTTARVARLDRDAAGSAERLTELLASFARREIDILVGTQMVAKGHDFPGVTLVCVVMADTSLSLPDFRAGERTFQLLAQVAGRAGRGRDPGRVLVQTYNPEAEPIRRVVHHDFDGFAEQELRWRKNLAYPPYARMVAIRIEGGDADRTAAAARRMGDAAVRLLPKVDRSVRLLGPAPAPIARIKGKCRWQLLVKGASHTALVPLVAEIERVQQDLPSSIKVAVDVDPGGLL